MCGRKKCVGDTSAYSFIHSMVCPCSAPGTVLGVREASGQVQGWLGLHRGDLRAEEGHLTQGMQLRVLGKLSSRRSIRLQEPTPSLNKAILSRPSIGHSSFVIYKGAKISEEREKLQAGFGFECPPYTRPYTTPFTSQHQVWRRLESNRRGSSPSSTTY